MAPSIARSCAEEFVRLTDKFNDVLQRGLMLVKILLGKPLRESGAETFALFNKSVSLFGRLTHDRNRNVSVALQATGIVIVEKLLNCSYQIGVWHRPGIDEEHELFAIAKTIFHSRMTVGRKSMIFSTAPPRQPFVAGWHQQGVAQDALARLSAQVRICRGVPPAKKHQW